jgi:rare lipoprotein A (peptidoglycan hydrolase)
MVMIRKSRKLGLNTPLGMWLIAACSSVALTAVVAVTFATRIVHADARLSNSIVPISSASVNASSTTFDKQAARVADQETAKVAARAERTAINRGDRLHGIASWYGGVFNGRKTASGERYDMYGMTACHPTLPFGSLVRVINHRNHRSVVVKITDRGDLVEQNRIIDLSYGAARQLAMVKTGLASVDLEVLALGERTQ